MHQSPITTLNGTTVPLTREPLDFLHTV